MKNCPKCGKDLDYNEVDIGVGAMQFNVHCPYCNWLPEPSYIGEEDYEKTEG